MRNTIKKSYSISSIGNSYYTFKGQFWQHLDKFNFMDISDKENKNYINHPIHPKNQMKEESREEIYFLKIQANENKQEISRTKQKVYFLEEQIVDITDKIDKFKCDTDKIIEGITRRIQEAELKYEENQSPCKSNTYCDVTMNKVKSSVKNTMNHFSIT